MTIQSVPSKPAVACLAQDFIGEWGVCRGEAIDRIDELNAGDCYHLKRTARWHAIHAIGDTATQFERPIAANVEPQNLTALAALIFMTTTGRRVDITVTASEGQVYLVTDTPLVSGLEYILIHIEKMQVHRSPALVQGARTVVAKRPANHQGPARAYPPLRLIG